MDLSFTKLKLCKFDIFSHLMRVSDGTLTSLLTRPYITRYIVSSNCQYPKVNSKISTHLHNNKLKQAVNKRQEASVRVFTI